MSPAIGMPMDRFDGPAKVSGQARYTADIPLENLAYGVLVQSTIARGRITRIDTAAAEAAAGVLGVLTHLNAPRFAGTGAPPPFGQPFIPLQDDVIHYSGQHIAVVVADTLEHAAYAAVLVKVEYSAEAPVGTLEDGLAQAIHPGEGSFRPPDSLRGDPPAGLAAADVQIDQTYTTPIHHHNPMEPSATTAVWEGDRLTLYDATQGVTFTRMAVAAILGLPPENVRVVSQFLGGGFGCKGFDWPHNTLAAVAARHVGRPVKLVLTRAQGYTSHGFQTATHQRLRLGATRDGRLTAIVHESTSQTAPYNSYVEYAGVASERIYACPNVQVTHRIVRVNAITPTPLRSPQEALGMVTLESALDELAYALGMDPLELRIQNHADVAPDSGRPWSSKALLDCYRLGAERFGWAQRTPQPRSMRDGNVLVGWGMGSGYHPDYRQPAAARARIMADPSAGSGQVRALVQSGTQDIGTGTYTVMAQVAAETLGLPAERVRFELGDTDMPPAPFSAGSTTVGSVAPAVYAAALAARAEVVRLAIGDPASLLYGAREDEIGVEDGRLFVLADPSRGETYAEVLGRHGREVVEGTARVQPGEERQQFAIGSFGAVFVEVRVDPDLGEVRVSRVVGVYDVGRVLNPKTARSQLIGGIIWGIGQALTEETVTDRRMARILTPNLSRYLMPVHADVPDIDVHFVDAFDPYTNPLGTKNIGEVGPMGVPGAIANAVYHATGKRIRDFPITPDKLL